MNPDQQYAPFGIEVANIMSRMVPSHFQMAGGSRLDQCLSAGGPVKERFAG